MTAAGKTTVTRLTTGTRFLITDDRTGGAASATPDPAGRWHPARNKKGMVIATFVRHNPFSGAHGRSSYDLEVTLPSGETATVADQVGHQTVWLAPEPAPTASEGKTLGEMAPAERADAIRRAAARMQDELTSNASAISVALESVDEAAQVQPEQRPAEVRAMASNAPTVPNRAHGVQTDTTLSGTVPAGFNGSTVVGYSSSGQPTVVAYVEHHDVTDAAPAADPFDPDAMLIERHRRSVTQGEVSVSYRGELLGRYGDDVQICTSGSNGRDPHPHADGASCFGGFHGRADQYWIDSAAATIAKRATFEPAPTGIDAEIAAKVSELEAVRAAFTANAERRNYGNMRTKSFGRRTAAALRIAGQLNAKAERLARDIAGLRRKAAAPPVPVLDLTRLPFARFIRTDLGWFKVVKVNRVTVKVVVEPGWDDLIKIPEIREIREATPTAVEAPTPAEPFVSAWTG